MRPTSVLGLLGLGLVGAAAFFGMELRKQQDAEARGKQAALVLAAPLDKAPELERIESSRAAAMLDEALALHDTPRLRGLRAWARALDAVQKGRAENAVEPLADALELLGDSVELATLDALRALRSGKLDEAQACLERARKLDPEHPRAELVAADLAIERQDFEGALALLESVRRAHPQLGGVENRRGVALEALGRTSDAIAAYESALRLGGSDVNAHVNLGRLQREAGQHRKAELAFDRAIASAPTRADAWLGRGLCRVAQGDLAGGAHDLERARELSPAQSAPLIALADLDVHAGELARAVDRYRAALLITEGDAIAWLKLGNAQMRLQRYGEAHEAFARAIEHDGQLAAAHNGLGAARIALGDTAGAAEALTIAAALDAADPNPLRNLALLHERQGNRRAAREAREEALARLR